MEYNAPRGSIWAANIFAFLLEGASKLFALLKRKKVPPEIREANQMRRAAARVSAYNHSLAADLYAAADRHDRDVYK